MIFISPEREIHIACGSLGMDVMKYFITSQDYCIFVDSSSSAVRINMNQHPNLHAFVIGENTAKGLHCLKDELKAYQCAKESLPDLWLPHDKKINIFLSLNTSIGYGCAKYFLKSLKEYKGEVVFNLINIVNVENSENVLRLLINIQNKKFKMNELNF